MKNKMDGENQQSPNELNMPHLAGGGLFDVDQGDTSTARIPYAPPMPMAPQPMPQLPQGPTFNPKAVAPPVSVPPIVPQVAPIPTAPIPDNSQADLQGQLGGYKAGLSKYGPEQQLAVEEAITKGRRGLGRGLVNAGAGFGDVLVSLGGGRSNFQNNLENTMDKTEEGIRSSYERANTNSMAKMKAEMELAQMDPLSPISRSAQRANRSTLEGLGLTEDEIASMPASLIGEATTKRLSLEDIRSKAALAEATLNQTASYQGQMLENTRRGQASDSKNRETARKMEAAKGLSSRPWYQKGFEAVAPDSMKSDSTKALQEQLSNVPSFQDEGEALAAGLAPGTQIMIGGRKARIK